MKDEFRSNEELYFSWWLDELKEAGYINYWEYEPESFTLIDSVRYSWWKQLKTKEKHMESTLLNDLCYTPDFFISWRGSALVTGLIWDDDESKKKGAYEFATTGLDSWVDVKGSFDRNKSNSTFSIIQKVMYDKTGIYVEKVVPEKLFAATFTPKRYLLTDKSGKSRKIKWEVRMLDEISFK